MSSIHPTKSGSHEVIWYENGKRKTKTRSTRADAEVLQARVDRLLAEGESVVRREDVPLLEDFAKAELAKRVDLEPSTRAKYDEWLETHVFPQLGHLPLVDLTVPRLAFWQDERLEAGAGPAVLGKAQGLLQQLLNDAVIRDYLKVNPLYSLDRPAVEKREARWLTAAQVELLRGWFLEREDVAGAALISVLAYVGIRPQDALARTVDDVGKKLSVTTKVSDGEIRPGSKTGKAYRRRVYLVAAVAQDLDQLNGEGLLFFRPKDGAPWTKKDWDNWSARKFKKAAVDVGLGETLRPYDLRHTCATLCAAAGWSHVEIAHQLGHSPEESMRTYQHLIDAESRGRRGTIEDYISEARSEQVVVRREQVESTQPESRSPQPASCLGGGN